MACMGRGLQALAVVAAAVFLIAADSDLTRGDTARGGRALDGVVFTLESGEPVRLAGLHVAPRDTPMDGEARAALEALVAGQELRLRQDEERTDRRGRRLAHVYAGAGAPDAERVWAQGALLSAGLARVETTPRTASMAAEMLAAEAEARAAGRGLWALPEYAVRTPDPYALAQELDTFQIVEGVVVDAAETRDFFYLNFGLDYRTDFTISIAARDLDEVREAGLEPLDLEGARIRVRGYLHAVNGPMIDVTHAAQIEVLD
jgi:endonuclease YncB( thermonuclease family)